MFKAEAEEGMLTLALMAGVGEVVFAAKIPPRGARRLRLATNEAVWARHSRSAENEAVWALLDHLMITPELDQDFV